MECPNCHHQNPDGANFCQNCGHKLESACPACGTANSLTSRFCQNCGNRLSAMKEAPAGPSPSGDVSGAFTSERRIVTILFADVKGSTSIAEQLDPEEWTEIMNGAFERLIPAITRYGGTVARLMGDAVLALFGAPLAHEDDPYRAVLAGLDIIDDLRPYQDRILGRLIGAGLRPDPSDFEVRVGINTGLVVVGRVGSDQSGEYTAMGDAVNLAARMEQTADPGTIQIAQYTYRHVAALVHTEPLGEIEVKGKRDPVLSYRIIGLRAGIGRLHGVAGLDAPMIGREAEMVRLRSALVQLQAGSGQISCLIGEAGLGKSRLIQELKRETAEIPSIQWYDAFSLSFETGQPYGLLRRLLRRVCSCTQNNSAEVVRQRVSLLVQSMPVEMQPQLSAVLASLFSLKLEGGGQPLRGEELKRELFACMSAFWLHQAARHPVVVVLDDLHWTDAASVELVRHLFGIADRAAIFFLCVFRPNRQSPAWGLKQLAESNFPHRYLELSLSPLNAHESDALVEGLLQATELPVGVSDLIREKAEGNPFFAEEIVRELIESEMILPLEGEKQWRLAGDIHRLDIPDSLEAVLVARIDRLPEATRHALQLAAVIGRSFYYRVLELVAADINGLDQHLRTLQQVGLVQEAARAPELEYMFRHVLTQEAAYNTILLKRRRHFHQRTGEVMEQLFADRLDEHAPLLAHHFLRAGDQQRSLRYLMLAGENAARLHANAAAIDHYSMAIATVDAASVSVDDWIRLHRGRGLAYEVLGMFDKALIDLELVLQSAREAQRKRDLWQAMLDLGKLWASRNYQKTEMYFQEALETARQLEDPVALGRSLNRLGNWYVNADRAQEGMRYHLEAKTIFDDLDNRKGRADTLDLLGMASLLGGDPVAMVAYYSAAIAEFEALGDRMGLASSLTARMGAAPGHITRFIHSTTSLREGSADGKRGLQLSREIGWRAGESLACWMLSCNYGMEGRIGQALAAAQDALAIATEIDHKQWLAGSYFVLGSIYVDLLHPDLALEMSEMAAKHAREVNSQYFIHLSAGPLAMAHLQLGDEEQALAGLQPLLSPEMPMLSQGQRIVWAARAEVALAAGDGDLALQIVERLIAAPASMPADGVISSLWHLRARILMAGGRTSEAQGLLLAGIENALLLGEKTLLWRLYGTLGQVYRERARVAEAREAISRAEQIIDEVAASVPEPSLRDNFVRRAKKQIEAE